MNILHSKSVRRSIVPHKEILAEFGVNMETFAAMLQAEQGVGLRSYSSFRELRENVD